MKKLNAVPRIDKEFKSFENTYYMPSNLTKFNSELGTGLLNWESYERKARFSFSQVETPFNKLEKHWMFPNAYSTAPATPFKITFISSNSFRLRINSKESDTTNDTSLMIDHIEEKTAEKYGWEIEKSNDRVKYIGDEGSIEISYNPWSLKLLDKKNKDILKTRTIEESVSLKNDESHPFSFVDKPVDKQKFMGASFTLSPSEKIYGTGESFTGLNKRGQVVKLYTRDPMGTLNQDMYKPIPFYLSSNGYGIFTHTSSPVIYDFGHDNADTQTIYTGDDHLDLFFFLGEPKKVLSEYTDLTGKSDVPPLWSFGFWMSRITYKSEEEVREVAKNLRKHDIPSDVIHLDTGWFEEDWKCDYKFSETRFEDPVKLIEDLNKDGFKVSLWQLPYFTPENSLYDEIIEQGLAVSQPGGGVPTEDAVLDFTNPKAVKWYQNKISKLLKDGVSAIKADFGEGAPLNGLYANGNSGFLEHNMYPLRYNKAVSDVTKEVNNESIIWARSAWAGSQRYPIHWGGDTEINDNGMAAVLRGGLSLGLSGFTFWSNDLGGFTRKSPEDLYRRWLGLGVFTSHLRAHGEPPKEPWEYSDEFLKIYRKSLKLRYKLMPYIYSESVKSAYQGWPLLRTLFFENPDDPIAWFIEDQYYFGSEMIIAPFIENDSHRNVYLPEGTWVDLITQKEYEGKTWYSIEQDKNPILAFIKKGSIIPTIDAADSTSAQDWSNITLNTFGEVSESKYSLYLPKERLININIENEEIRVEQDDSINFKLKTNYEL